jgi:methylenetetrahydrofolate reductase (NADPH)
MLSRASAAELLASGSLEIGAHRPQDAHEIAALLPGGTPVYVNHLPRHRLLDTVSTLVAVRKAGLEPVPHIAARRIRDQAELREFIARATGEAGVQKALILGGDQAEAAGPYADGAAILRESFLTGSGLREIGLPGYPEGHPRIPAATLESAFAEKLLLAAAHGLGTYMVTQFSFAPARVVEFCTRMARQAPGMSIYVGLAGPTNPVALLRFAQRCGVSASLGAARDPYGPGRPTFRDFALLRRACRLQRGRRAPVHLRRRRRRGQLDQHAAEQGSRAPRAGVT